MSIDLIERNEWKEKIIWLKRKIQSKSICLNRIWVPINIMNHLLHNSRDEMKTKKKWVIASDGNHSQSASLESRISRSQMD